MKIGYARVSTNEQELGLQITALNNYGCDEIWTEKTSAVKERPELTKVLQKLRRGDTLVIWKLDRLARSLRQLIILLDDLKNQGIELVSISDFIISSSAQSMLYTQIIGAFAQFERELMIERTKAGLEDAKRRGVILGRKPGLSITAEKKAEAIIQLYTHGTPVEIIAEMMNISISTFYRYLHIKSIPMRSNAGRKKR